MKIIKLFFLHFAVLILLGACGDQNNYADKIASIEKKQDMLAKKIEVLEERLFNIQKEKKQVNPPPLIPQPIPKIEPEKKIISGIPSSFDYPEYSLKIKDFSCYEGMSGLAVYNGMVITSKDVQIVALRTEFFNAKGKLIGGHAFPVNVLTSGVQKRFDNSDIVEGGFKKISKMNITVDYISYSDFRIKGKEVENPRF